MNFLDKLDFLMKSKELNKHSLSSSCGIPYTTIDAFYKKGYSNAKLSTIIKIADYFHTSIDYLVRDEINNPNYNSKNDILSVKDSFTKDYSRLDTHGKKIVDSVLKIEINRIEQEKKAKSPVKDNIYKISVITYDLPASAGTGAFLDGDDCEHVEYPVDDVPYGTDFAVKIQGDSMEPDYMDGGVAFVRKQSEINNGDIGIFVLNGEGFIKQIKYNNGNVYLVSLNPAYDDIKVLDTDDFRCSGKVLN